MSANKAYVLVRVDGDDVQVYGNRHGMPFSNEINAQRSCTRRSNGTTKRGVLWYIEKLKA